ncbi:Conserved_hypothetical protein [Hexamita inflata]|uniref:Uncharacterized protein n=1 Tax=Hexamita inflata TaxID=28002 RepID=A0AA86QKF2_9EUKA|nr:Conserved hypothetical protein [Hexamita inflata]
MAEDFQQGQILSSNNQLLFDNLGNKIILLEYTLQQQQKKYAAERQLFSQQFQNYREQAEDRISQLQTQLQNTILSVYVRRKQLCMNASEVPELLQQEVKFSDFRKQEIEQQNEIKIRELQETHSLQLRQLQEQNKLYESQIQTLKLLCSQKQQPGHISGRPSNRSFDEPFSSIRTQNLINVIRDPSISKDPVEDFTQQTDKQNSVKTQNPILEHSLPWVLANEAAYSTLSQNHAAVLDENKILTDQVQKLVSKVRLNEKYALMYQKNQKTVTDLQHQLETEQIKYNTDVSNYENLILKNKEERDLILAEHQKTLNSHLAQQQALILENNQLKTQLLEQRDTIFAEQTIKQKLNKQQDAGAFQQQIVYLLNFEQIYKRTLKELTERIAELNVTNEELRLQQLKFNDRIIEMKEEIQQKVQNSFEPLLQSLNKTKSANVAELIRYKVLLDKQVEERNTMKEMVEQANRESDQLKHFLQEYQDKGREQSTQVNQMQNSVKTLQRNLIHEIQVQIEMKQKVNSCQITIQQLKEQLLNTEVTKNQIIHSLSNELIKHLRADQINTHPLEQVQQIIQTAQYVKVHGIQELLPETQLAQVKFEQESLELSKYEKQILELQLDQVSVSTTEVQTDTKTLVHKEVQCHHFQTFTSDVGQQVSFYSSESELLQAAYQQIENQSKQLKKYESMYSSLDTLKDRLFQEAYKEDIAMVAQWRNECAMMRQDNIATMERYLVLLHKVQAHRCPTFEDFKPIVDEMMQKLENEKNTIIQKLENRQSELENDLILQQNATEFQKSKYIKLKGHILNFKPLDLQNQKLEASLQKLKSLDQSLDQFKNLTDYVQVQKEMLMKKKVNQQTQTLSRPTPLIINSESPAELVTRSKNLATTKYADGKLKSQTMMKQSSRLSGRFDSIEKQFSSKSGKSSVHVPSIEKTAKMSDFQAIQLENSSSVVLEQVDSVDLGQKHIEGHDVFESDDEEMEYNTSNLTASDVSFYDTTVQLGLPYEILEDIEMMQQNELFSYRLRDLTRQQKFIQSQQQTQLFKQQCVTYQTQLQDAELAHEALEREIIELQFQLNEFRFKNAHFIDKQINNAQKAAAQFGQTFKINKNNLDKYVKPSEYSQKLTSKLDSSEFSLISSKPSSLPRQISKTLQSIKTDTRPDSVKTGSRHFVQRRIKDILNPNISNELIKNALNIQRGSKPTSQLKDQQQELKETNKEVKTILEENNIKEIQSESSDVFVPANIEQGLDLKVDSLFKKVSPVNEQSFLTTAPVFVTKNIRLMRIRPGIEKGNNILDNVLKK